MSYILKKGEREIGPMESDHLVALLQSGDCLPTDLIRPEDDPDGWRPASALFPDGSWSRQDVEPTLIGSKNPVAVSLRQLLNEEQDEGVARELINALAGKLGRVEVVRAVAVQKKPVLNFAPDALVATSERLLIVRNGLFGKSIEGLAYADLAEIAVTRELLGATVRFASHAAGKKWELDSLPKESAEQVVRWVRARQQQLEAEPLEVEASDDPLARLRRLKAMLDEGLITAAEYEAKKRAILPEI